MVRFFPVWMLGFITLSLITTPPVHCNVSGRDVVVALLPCKSFSTETTASGHSPVARQPHRHSPAARQPHRRIVLLAPIDPSINCTTLRALSKRGGGGGDRLRHHKKTGMTLNTGEVGRYCRRFVDANKKHPRRRRSASKVLSS
nr:hypothetical protein DM860_003664 [Ipomoea batatas]